MPREPVTLPPPDSTIMLNQIQGHYQSLFSRTLMGLLTCYNFLKYHRVRMHFLQE